MKLTPLFIVLLLIFIGCLFLVVSAEAKNPKAYYDASTNSIVVVDGTEAKPATLTMILQNDTLHGWGLVTRQGITQFRINCNLRIGNSSNSVTGNQTFFLMKNESLEIYGFLNVTRHSTMQAGRWTDGHAKDGCYIRNTKVRTVTVYNNVWGNATFYGTILRGVKHNTTTSTDKRIYFVFAYASHSILKECLFEEFRGVQFFGNFSKCSDVIMRNVSNPFFIYVTLDQKWDQIYSPDVYSATHGVNWGRIIGSNIAAGTTNKIFVWDCFATNYVIYGLAGQESQLTIVNWKNPPTNGVIIGASITTTSFIQYNFTLRTRIVDSNGLPISNAFVRVWNKTGGLVFNITTATNGTASQQQLSLLIYRGNAYVSDTANPAVTRWYTPYRIIVNKTGYQIYNTTFNLSQALNWTIALQPECPVSSGTATPQVLSRDIGITMLAVGLLIGLITGPMFFVLKKRRKRNVT